VAWEMTVLREKRVELAVAVWCSFGESQALL
jgi:hypothetical protein